MAAKHVASASGLTGTSTSVVIDVYGEDDPTTKLATVPNGDIDQVGSETVYACDLRASTVAASLGLPKDGEAKQRRYILVWKDDVVNKVVVRETVDGQGGQVSRDRMFRRETFVYPSTTVPTRGITAEVVKRGKPSYMTVELSPIVGDFSNPAETYYMVFYYNASGLLEKAENSATVPSP